MADITLHRENAGDRTSIPNYFIDHYMAGANGEYVKVYLYLLRCMGDPSMNFSISDFADKFDHTEKDILRALKYWEKMSFIRLEFDSDKELTGICFLDTPAFLSPKEPVKVAKKETPPDRPSYSPSEIRKLRSDESFQELVFVAENYMGHCLNTTEANSILYWKDSLHFSNELIDYLIEYCVDKGKKSIHYMDKVALGWAESGITTVAQAREIAAAHSNSYYAIKKAFGISGRDFVKYESDYIHTWTEEYGLTTDIIVAACERTIKNIHQVSFEYADTILKNWRKQKVCTLKDIEALDALHESQKKQDAARFSVKNGMNKSIHNLNERQYDMTQLEKTLLGIQV